MIRKTNYLWLILVTLIAIPECLKSQTLDPPIDETLYCYQSKLQTLPENITDLNFYNFDFPCVVKQKVAPSTVPRTIYKIADLNGEKLIGEEDGMLVWKGFRAKDPYFGIPETFVQFVGGVPIFNQDDPTSFDLSGRTIFYLYYYKLEELPKRIQEWAKLKQVDKIKMKVELSYSKAFVEETTSSYSEGPTYILSSEITMNVVEIKGKRDKEWALLPLNDNPVFEEYLYEVKQKYTSMHSETAPLGTIYLYEEPEFKVEFTFNEVQLNVPDCTSTDQQIYVFPNPNFGQVNIKMLDMSAGAYFFDIYNIAGHKVWSNPVTLDKDSNLIKFDLPTLDKGIYLYSVKSDKGVFLQSRRLVIVEP